MRVRLKPFDRFAHEGVLAHLERVKAHFAGDPHLEFGTFQLAGARTS